MNDIQIFSNMEFGTVRTLTINDEAWFVGKDIAEILGYTNPQEAIRNHIDEQDKGVSEILTPGGKQKTTVINESGLYDLIIFSKLPKAKQFRRWVTSEILPSIRKSGGYIAGQEDMSDTELMAKALVVAQKQIEQRNAQIERMRPKEIFADAVAASKTSILIGELAKLLKQNGIDIGQKRLFDWLRNNGYLIRYGSGYNLPTQKAMEMCLFEIKETTVNNPDGSIRINKTTKVTGKGQQYFINKFLKAVN